MGYECFGDHCRDRLGISESTARRRIRLEEGLVKLPPLREALIAGRITYTKALAVARGATLLDVRDQIAAAAETTWQQTDREAREEEARARRGRGRPPEPTPRASRTAIRAFLPGAPSSRRCSFA